MSAAEAPPSAPRIASAALQRRVLLRIGPRIMGVILLEALGALALLVFIVWWTMFSGRKGGERPDDRDAT